MMALVVSSCTKPDTKKDLSRAETDGSSNNKSRTVVVTKVIKRSVETTARLPGDLLAYRDVGIYPKVAGFVEWIGVDRGSIVKKGQVLIKMMAPEVVAQKSEAGESAEGAGFAYLQAERQVQVTRSGMNEATAKLAADEMTYKRLRDAHLEYSATVSKNDLEVAEKKVEADRARVESFKEQVAVSQAKVDELAKRKQARDNAARSASDIESYLRISAPFDGIITERNVHEGSLVNLDQGIGSNRKPMLRIQELAVLRLVVPVPEMNVGGLADGATVNFTVAAFRGETFTGVISRIGHALDLSTRTMPVELDVKNNDRKLAPGMYAEVQWPVKRAKASLLVPQSSIVRTTERLFVVRVKDNKTEWVDVKTGVVTDSMIEVFGDLEQGDQVALKGTDELRPGIHVSTKPPPSNSL